MKIKQLPEDFIVEEVAKRDILPSGAFKLFLLEKKGLDSFGAKKIIGKEFKVSSQEIGMAGLKDKHALTRQYISIPARFNIPVDFSQQSIALKQLGFIDKPILLGGLECNRFTITIRDIKKTDLERLKPALKQVFEFGVPNYFDSQRFGSLRGAVGFIAKDLIKSDFERALKILLTSSSRHDKAEVRNCRKAIAGAWGHWDICLAACKKAPRARREKRMIEFLKERPADFKGAFLLVERELVKMFFSAYQSYLWNETVQVLLNRTPGLAFRTVDYQAGHFLFPKNPTHDIINKFAILEVPLLRQDVEFPMDDVKFAALKVLKEEELTLENLTSPLKEAQFKPGKRLAWVQPRLASDPKFSPDELNSAPTLPRQKLVISFELPPGSYATIVLKALGVEKKKKRR